MTVHLSVYSQTMSTPPISSLASKKRTHRAFAVIASVGISVAFAGRGLAQPVYTADTAINSTVAFAVDISITNSAKVDLVTGGNLSVGPNEVFVGGTEFATGTGTLTLAGGADLSNRAASVGFFAGSSGNVSISGAGTTWSNTATVFIGRSGAGTLAVGDQAQVTSLAATLGHASGSSGTVTLSNAGTSWTTTSGYIVGRQGTGDVTVQSGADASTFSLTLGSSVGGLGNLTVSGAGSTWSSSQSVSVGSAGTGNLLVSNGGVVSNGTSSVVGNDATANGTVSITGAGSAWNSANPVYIGLSGHGSANVSNGGTLSGKLGVVGFFNGGSGEVVVTGTGSTWLLEPELYIGYEGTGTVTVSNGGSLSFVGGGNITLGDQVGGNGTLHVGAGAASPAAPAGVVGAVNVREGLGAGTLQFNTTGNATAPTYFTRDGTQAGVGINTSSGLSLVHTAGLTVFSGTLAHTDTTQVNGGVFVLTGNLTNSPVTVFSGAKIGGTGIFGANVTALAGAEVGSDYGTGTLTFTQGLTLDDNAILNFDLGTVSDLIRVSGGTLLGEAGGTIWVNLRDAGDFAGGIFTLIDATGASLESISATSFEIDAAIGGYSYQIVREADQFKLVASPIPEPSSWATLAGLTGLLFATRRRLRA